MDFRQRLEQSNTRLVDKDAPADADNGGNCPFYAVDRVKNPACLDLRLPEGMRFSMPYSYLTEISYDMEMGIEILTKRKRIVITGRYLDKLYEALITYRVKYVQTNIGNDGAEDGLFVKEILIGDVNEF